MGRQLSLAEQLREAFLRGEKILASEYAREKGVTRAGVSDAMRTFGELVRGRTVRVGTHARGLEWECVDIEGMRRWIPKPRFVPRRERAPIAQTSNDLMQVWGMRVVDIALPSQRHSMAMDDSLEEAA